MVYVEKILVDHIRLFGGVWKWGKNGISVKVVQKIKKKLYAFYYHTWVFDQDLRSYTLFWGSW